MPLEWLGSRSHELNAVRERGAAWTAPRNGESIENGGAAAGVLVQPPPAELYVLDTVAPRVPMDRDLLIAWRPQVGVAPAVAALTETVGDTTYALLMILPPPAHTARLAAARADLRHRYLGLDGRRVDRAGEGGAQRCARPFDQRRSFQRDPVRFDDVESVLPAGVVLTDDACASAQPTSTGSRPTAARRSAPPSTRPCRNRRWRDTCVRSSSSPTAR